MSDNLRDDLVDYAWERIRSISVQERGHRPIVAATVDALMPRIEQARLEAFNNGLKQGYDTGCAQGQARLAAILARGRGAP